MKFSIINALLFTALICTASASQADAFRWVDDEGKVHIGIKPADKPKKDVTAGTEAVDEGISKAPPVAAKPAPPKAVVNAPVKTPQPSMPAAKAAPVMAPVVVVPKKATPAPALVVPSQAPKVVKKPVSKKSTVVKKPVTKPATKKSVTKTTTVKKTTKKKKAKPKKTTTAKKKTADADSKRNEEMCGVFTGYVVDYEEKVSSCSANLCDIYKRSLARYQKKQKSYCG